jgi:tetratricopeptide (TPR) repeat protein
LAGSFVNYGNALRAHDRTEEALESFAKAIALLEGNLTQDSQEPLDRLFLRNAHWSRARALTDLGRYGEAVHDLDLAIELDEGPSRPFYQLHRAICLARAGEHAKAAAEANALSAIEPHTAGSSYNLACVFSLCSAGVDDDARQQMQYAGRAMELLKKALAAGFTDAAHLKQDTDLAALRDRTDFQQLVTELEKKATPKPSAK